MIEDPYRLPLRRGIYLDAVDHACLAMIVLALLAGIVLTR